MFIMVFELIAISFLYYWEKCFFLISIISKITHVITYKILGPSWTHIRMDKVIARQSLLLVTWTTHISSMF